MKTENVTTIPAPVFSDDACNECGQASYAGVGYLYYHSQKGMRQAIVLVANPTPEDFDCGDARDCDGANEYEVEIAPYNYEPEGDVNVTSEPRGTSAEERRVVEAIASRFCDKDEWLKGLSENWTRADFRQYEWATGVE